MEKGENLGKLGERSGRDANLPALAQQGLPVAGDDSGERGLVPGGKSGLKLLFVHGVPPFIAWC